jgi:hypothetical protein
MSIEACPVADIGVLEHVAVAVGGGLVFERPHGEADQRPG